MENGSERSGREGKVMKNKGLIFVIGIVAIVLVVTGIFTIRHSNDSKSTFDSDGYIIAVDDKEVIEKDVNEQHYFKAGERYQVKYPEKITFQDTKGKQVVSDKAMFVHYLDNSISAFTKGVIINLDEKNAKDQYYGIGETVPLYYGNDGYQMNYMSEKLNMKNFIWKISDTDFMVVSDQIHLELTDDVKVDFPQYIQLKYVGEGIVRIVHQEGTYQTISEDATATLSNGVSLHLTEKELYEGEESFADLNSMIIDSDTNLIVEEAEEPDIASYIPKFNVIDGQNGSQGQEGSSGDDGDSGQSGNKGSDGYDGAGGNTGKKGTVGGSGSSGENGASGSTGNTGYDGIHATSGEDGERGRSGEEGESPETANTQVLHEPTIAVETFEIGLNSLKAKLTITDVDECLRDQQSVAIYKRNNMETVFTQTIPVGATSYTLNTNSLSPDTEYVLIVSGNYETYDSAMLSKDFLSKVFKTDSMGVSMTKKVAACDSLCFEVKADATTNVATAVLVLKSKDGTEVGSQVVNIAEAVTEAQGNNKEQARIEVRFDGLAADSEYEATLGSITLLDASLMDSMLPITVYTLKQEPDIVSIKPATSTNRRSGEIIVDLAGVRDVNHGVTGYCYELYAASDITPEVIAGSVSVQAEPVAVIQADKQGSQSFKVNGVTIKNNQYYYARVVAKFYDNEKEVECASQFTDAICVDGSEFPTVNFAYEEDYCTWERIKGAVRINDAKDVVVCTADYPVTILLTSGLADPVTYTVRPEDIVTNSDGTFSVPFDFNQLKTEESYTLSIYGFIDLNGNWDNLETAEKANCRCLLGNSFKKTNTPDYLVVNTENNQLNSQSIFSQKFWLTGSDYEAKTLSTMTLELYAGYPQAGKEPIATTVLADQKTEFYESTLHDSYFESDPEAAVTKYMIVDPESFGLADNELEMDAEYYVVVSKGYDYTSYPNELPFRKKKDEGEGFEEAIFPITLQNRHMAPANVNNAVTVKPITNADVEKYSETLIPNDSLKDNTIVGLSVKAKYSLEDVQKVTYTAVKCKKEIPSDVEITDQNASEYLTNETETREVICKAESSLGKAGVKEWNILFDEDSTDMFERGKTYVFYYSLDTDGTIDCYQRGDDYKKHRYPDCVYKDVAANMVPRLRSESVRVEKQVPDIEAYLYTTDFRNGKSYASWKYRLVDPDSAMLSNGTLLIDKSSAGGTVDPEDAAKGIHEFRLFEYELDNLSADNEYKLQGEYVLCEGDEKVQKDYYTSKYQKVVSSKTFDATVIGIDNIGANRVQISVKGKETNDIAALRVTVKEKSNPDNKKVISPIMLDGREEFEDGSVTVYGYVELKDIKDFLGKEITFTVEGYYDTNRTGYKNSTDEFYALQTFDDELKYKKVTINAEYDTALISNIDKVINNSIFKVYNFNGAMNSLNKAGYHIGLLGLTHYLEGESEDPFELNMVYDDNTGLLKEKTENVYYALKRLGVSNTIDIDDSLSGSYQYMDALPTIKKFISSAGLSSATIDLIVKDLSDVPGQQLYAKLYKVENGSRIPQKIIYKNVNLDESNNYDTYMVDDTQSQYTTNGVPIVLEYDRMEVNFSGLKDNASYAVKFYMIGDDGNEIYLYDYEEKAAGIEYTFKTTTNIRLGFNGITYEYTDYLNKYVVPNMVIPGNVSDGIGILAYYTVKDEEGNTVIGKTPISRKGDTIKYYDPAGNRFRISFTPGGAIKPGSKYTVEMTAYSEHDDNNELIGKGTSSFTTPKFIAPSFYVQGTSSVETTQEGVSLPTMSFRVVESDSFKTVVDGAYMVRFFDRKGNRITTTYDGQVFTETTKTFDLNHETMGDTKLEYATQYSMTVYTMINLENKGSVAKISDDEITRVNNKYLYKVSSQATTIDNFGIDVGSRSYSSDPDGYATVYFNNSMGLDQISQVTYSVYRQSGDAIIPVFNVNEEANFDTASGGYSKKLSYKFTGGTYYLIMQFYNSEGVLVQQFNNDVITIN